MIKKIVIPAAGLGSRLLPMTKEVPKEMMPMFFKDGTNGLIVKPLIQMLFEQFYLHGIREYCFIVGKQKRTIEDHFTPDYDFLHTLNNDNKARKDLETFYSKLNHSKIFWINQHKPTGFGDAVLSAESFVGDQDFIVSAGDTLISKDSSLLSKLTDKKLEGKNDAVLLLQEVPNPKRFGVAVVKKKGNDLLVTNVEEKPPKPRSNLAIVAVYRFRPSIFKALNEIKGNKKELQLTDGIQKLIDLGGKVHAIIVKKNINVIDIGTPESYLENLPKSH